MDSLLIDTSVIQLSRGDFFIRLLVTAGVGFLIGMEREYSAKKSGEKTFAGVRTFLFFSALGFLGGLLYATISVWLLAGVLLSVLTLVTVSYYVSSARGEIGGTTEVTAILVFILGLMSFMGFIEETLVITVGMMITLSSKFTLHEIIGKITQDEMFDLIRFIILALLIFPFLPNQNYGPYEVLNPREIGLVVLLISGIGFAGYLLMKFMGNDRGILVTGIIGGLVSSTAVTWVFSRKSKTAPALSDQCATAILAASAIMVIRVLVLIFLFNRTMFLQMLLPLSIVFLAAVTACLWFYFRSDKTQRTDAEIKNDSPLQLKGALIFGLIYSLILLLVSFANERFGSQGLMISGVISGFTDIDAITISSAKLGGKSLNQEVAEMTILLAIISNSVVKLGISLWAGASPLRLRMLAGYGLTILATLGALLFVALRQ